MGVKMVLSGEGADEELGGYLYFHKVLSLSPSLCKLILSHSLFVK